MNEYKLLINGRLEEGASTLAVINPATGQPFATCPKADANQLNQAVAAAKAAFPGWSALSIKERGEYLVKLADALEAEHQAFAQLLTQEQGKPFGQAMYEIGGAFSALRFFSAMDIPLKVIRENERERIIERRSPLGVVAAITPWNFPMILLMIKLAPALLAGNTLVVKPAPTTPLTTLELGRLCATLLPPGVVNIVTDSNDLGHLLTSHPDVAKVAFTGSTATGKKVMKSAADSLKRLTLELGGNDAAIVLDDVDVDTLVPKLFQAATLNAGQVCMAAKRIYVPRALYQPVCEGLAQLASAARVGNGLEPDTQIGPIQNRQQYEKVLHYLADSKAQGRILAGGNALPGDGYFVEPTVVCDVPDTAAVVCEEQFGPIIPVLAYDDLDVLIDAINASPFGLAGTVWGTDIERAASVAMRINSGTVWVNKHMDLPFDVPFGGAKQSGIGREQGQTGLEEFTQPHVVNIALA